MITLHKGQRQALLAAVLAVGLTTYLLLSSVAWAGQERITNGTFTSSTGWTTWQQRGSTTPHYNDTAHNPANTTQCVWFSTSHYNGGIWQAVTLMGGQAYTLSGYSKGTASNNWSEVYIVDTAPINGALVTAGLLVRYDSSSWDTDFAHANRQHITTYTPSGCGTVTKYILLTAGDAGEVGGSTSTSFGSVSLIGQDPAVPTTAPTVGGATGTSLNVAIASGDTGPAFAIRVNGSQYVQWSGALGASPVWQAKETWGTTTVTGLACGTSYTFAVAKASDTSGTCSTGYGPDTVQSTSACCDAPPPPDCNGNGVADSCDIANGTSQDCNGNGIPDSCDLASGTSMDCNHDGIPDECNRWLVPFVNPSFEDGLNGWTVTNAQIDPGTYVPSPAVLDGAHRAGYDNCYAWNSSGWQSVSVQGPVSLSGGLAGGDSGGFSYWVKLWDGPGGGTGTLKDQIVLSGVHNWVLFELHGQATSGQVTVEWGSTGDGSWGPAAYHVDNLVLSADGLIDCNGNHVPDECDLRDGTSRDCNSNGVPDECDIAAGTSQDCNGNGVPDSCDIANGTSQDCTANGIPDECEPDCNGNHIPDSCDIAAGTSQDCNGNGIPDSCDLATGTSRDCNGDNVPDECQVSFTWPLVNPSFEDGLNGWTVTNAQIDPQDVFVPSPPALDGAHRAGHGNGSVDNSSGWQSVPATGRVTLTGGLAGGTSGDLGAYTYWGRLWDGPPGGGTLRDQIVLSGVHNWVLFELHGQATSGQVAVEWGSTGDGSWGPAAYHVDNLVLSADGLIDCNGNHVPDECDLRDGTSRDCNSNGVPDECDIALRTSRDCNGNGVPDECESLPDCNHNGITDACDLVAGTSQDCNANGIPDECDIASGTSQDCNGNGVPDSCDIANGTSRDCNANGVPDSCDIASGTSRDCNANAIPDSCDITSGTSQDCNVNGVPDSCDIANGTSQDCNGNRVPDSCDIANGTSQDCNGNHVPDSCDIASGTSQDCNGNHVPDSCEITSGTSQDCNANHVPDSCDIANGTSTDVNHDGIPDECQIDVRVVPVATLIDPFLSSDVRTDLPGTISAVVRGGTYYVEIWASDVGSVNTGLTGVYVDVSFCGQTSATAVDNGSIFIVFPSGTIQSGKVDEFGGSALPSGGGIAPEWVRLGWIEMHADVDVPTCSISLSPSTTGVAALNRGLIPWAFVGLGSVSLQIQPPAKTYDLDGNGTINVGDLSLFAGSWLKSVPPGNAAHDFDCNNYVGVSDLSWFATGWNKNVSDPAIIYPPCPPGGGQSLQAKEASSAAVLAGGAAPLPAPGLLDSPADVAFKPVVLAAQSSSNTTTTLPNSVSSLVVGQTYYLEVWVSDVGTVNTGLTSAYVDLGFTANSVTVLSISHGLFTVFPSGTVVTGGVDELGGSVLPGGVAIEPEWARVAVVRMRVNAAPPGLAFTLASSSTGVAALARGQIPWGDISLDKVRFGHVTGDLDADGDVDLDDFAILDPCRSGTGVTPLPGCSTKDLDQDGDVDQSDFGILQRCYSGPNVPADPNCAS